MKMPPVVGLGITEVTFPHVIGLIRQVVSSFDLGVFET